MITAYVIALALANSAVMISRQETKEFHTVTFSVPEGAYHAYLLCTVGRSRPLTDGKAVMIIENEDHVELSRFPVFYDADQGTRVYLDPKWGDRLRVRCIYPIAVDLSEISFFCSFDGQISTLPSSPNFDENALAWCEKKNVEVPTDTLTNIWFRIDRQNDQSSVHIDIVPDTSAQTIKSFDAACEPEGDRYIPWDLRDKHGHLAPDGTYSAVVIIKPPHKKGLLAQTHVTLEHTKG